MERSDSKDIQGMLSRTGTQAPDGPLMDFTGDLKKAVPELKRQDTSGDDSFHDAKE
jgi:oxysterol-binding protein-related protein 8